MDKLPQETVNSGGNGDCTCNHLKCNHLKCYRDYIYQIRTEKNLLFPCNFETKIMISIFIEKSWGIYLLTWKSRVLHGIQLSEKAT